MNNEFECPVLCWFMSVDRASIWMDHWLNVSSRLDVTWLTAWTCLSFSVVELWALACLAQGFLGSCGGLLDAGSDPSLHLPVPIIPSHLELLQWTQHSQVFQLMFLLSQISLCLCFLLCLWSLVYCLYCLLSLLSVMPTFSTVSTVYYLYCLLSLLSLISTVFNPYCIYCL